MITSPKVDKLKFGIPRETFTTIYKQISQIGALRTFIFKVIYIYSDTKKRKTEPLRIFISNVSC